MVQYHNWNNVDTFTWGSNSVLRNLSRNQFLGVDTRHEQMSSSEYMKEVKREESVRQTKCRCGSYPDVVEGCFVSDVIEKEES